MTTKEEYQEIYKRETGHDFQRTPLEPETPIIKTEHIIEFALFILGSCFVLLMILMDVLK